MTPLAVFLLACATIFLGCVQAAFSSLMRLSLRLMAERGGRSDRLGEYLDDPLRLFVPVRLLIATCVLVAAVFLANATDVHNSTSLGLLIVALLGFVMLCEHVIPGFIVRRNPEAVLDLLLPAFDPLARAIRPVTMTIVHLIEHRAPEREAATGNGPAPNGDAAAAPPDAQQESAISEEAGRELLQSIVDFTETVVREVMTPRPDIVAITADSRISELRDLFREQQYSRIPVYRENLDNIVGIVFVKDLVALPPGAEPLLTTLMRPAYFVPASKLAAELLKELQRKQAHMAIVVDEYGGTAGLVTVEDLLEEIVGEIRDEYDVESETVVDEGNGRFVFSGKVSVDEVAERLDVKIAREGFETVGGYLLSHLGRMPYLGEVFEVDDLVAEVLEVDRRRITKVRLRRREPAQAEDT
jgi:putative hemolysin